MCTFKCLIITQKSPSYSSFITNFKILKNWCYVVENLISFFWQVLERFASIMNDLWSIKLPTIFNWNSHDTMTLNCSFQINFSTKFPKILWDVKLLSVYKKFNVDVLCDYEFIANIREGEILPPVGYGRIGKLEFITSNAQCSCNEMMVWLYIIYDTWSETRSW